MKTIPKAYLEKKHPKAGVPKKKKNHNLTRDNDSGPTDCRKNNNVRRSVPR